MSTNTERKSKSWWAILDDHSVDVVTGYECPNNYDQWWCPSIGYTLTVGYHLFKDKESAKARARQLIHEKLAVLQGQLAKLE